MIATLRSRSRTRLAAGMAAASVIAAGAWAAVIGGCGAPTDDEGSTVNVQPFGNAPGAGPSANGSGGSGASTLNSATPGVSCLPGQGRCASGRLAQVCNSTGTGFDPVTCDGANVCLAGAC